MRALLMAAAVLIGLGGIAWAQEPANLSQADQAAIRQVITRQLSAFRHDDATAAFALAAPHIQQMFGDAAHFLNMVRTQYQPVYRPRATAFGALISVGGTIVQRMEVVGPDGSPDLALYTMQHEPDGSWRIDGCMLVKTKGVEA